MQIHEKLHEASHITYRLLITNSTYTLKVRKENTDTLLIQTFYIELHITPYSSYTQIMGNSPYPRTQHKSPSHNCIDTNNIQSN